MLSYEQILELMDKLVESPLTEISIAQGEFQLSLKKNLPTKEIVFQQSSSAGPMHAHEVVTGTPPHYPAAEASPSLKAVPAAPVCDLCEIKSPMVGTFYAAPSPDTAPFVAVGDSVKTGDTLCIIEAMKVMNELPSDFDGSIVEICAKSGQTVEFGQGLFRLKKN